MGARNVLAGATAAGAAVLAMAGTAAGGLVLLGAGRVGPVDRLTAAVMAMAAGAPAEVGAVPSGGLPVSVHGRVDVMPLGVTLVGAVVLGALLVRRGPDGLVLRGLSSAVVLTAALGAVAWAARGSLTLPAGGAAAVQARGCASGGSLPGGSGRDRALDAGFAVGVGPAVAGAAVGAIAVVALCLLCVRRPVVAGGLRTLRWPVAAMAFVAVAAAWRMGGPAAAGGVVLAFPVVVLGPAGPWSVHADGMLACVLDGGRSLPTGVPFMVLSAAVVLVLGIAVAVRTPGCRAPVRALWLAVATGLLLAALAVLSRASAGLSAQAFILSVPLLDVRVAADPWLALAGGLGAGAVSGFAGSLPVGAFVGWRAWKRH